VPRNTAKTAKAVPSRRTAEISTITRIPARNELDTSTPNTAAASAPPVCPLALNSPPASPAWDSGSDSSSRNVSDGSANPIPAPAGTSAISRPRRPA
jgi:hypothetical protein